MKKFLMLFIVALTVLVQSCNNNDDLWAAIDDLKSRVQALEKNVKDLNGNIDALRELYSGKTISNVAVDGDKYVLTLSDGTKIELKQGSDADAVIPVVSIDPVSGMWQVSYDGGKTFESLGVKATANDGVTPQFRIDETNGYWQISYDGTEWANVLDTKGNPVKAVGTGAVTDKFFEDVQVKGDLFYIKLHDGTEMNIPILKDFMCVINTPAPGVQKFAPSETKTFQVDIKGADNTIVSAPDGWAASLSAPTANKATLTVTAPAGVTRASADNTKDVSILITSNSYASISKIQVELDNTVPAPTAAVANSTTVLPTASSLSFDVTVADADGWKYICLKSTDAAPAAAKILADGTAGTGTSVTVSGLDASTRYTLYVVAYNATQNSTVASAENTTAAPAAIDYWKDGITIDGVLFKEGVDGAQLITATTVINKALGDGVYFLDPAADAEISLTGVGANGFNKLVIIGRYSDKMPVVKLTGYLSMNATAAAFGYVFKNIVLDGTGLANYLFNSANSNASGINERLIIEDCKVITDKDKAYSYFSGVGSVKKTVIRNNRMVSMASTNNTSQTLLAYTQAGTVANMVSIEISNNIFYAPAFEPKLALVTMPNNSVNTNLTITANNNTFVNTPTSNGMIQVFNIGSITANKNLIVNSGVNSGYMTKIQNVNVVVSNTDNKVYKKDVTAFVLTNGGVLPTGVTENVILRAEEADPFDGGTFDLANGVFIPNSSYAGYGADLK